MHRVRSIHHGRRVAGYVWRFRFFKGSVVVYVHMCEGDAASLHMALAACLLGYGEVGLWLQREARRPESWVKIDGNPYKTWIEGYSGEKYQAAVMVGIGT